MAIKGLNFNIGNISSAKIKGGGLSNAAKFKPSILKLNTDQLTTNVGLIDDIISLEKRADNAEKITSSLMETNHILAEIQQQLALDFGNRIVEQNEENKKLEKESSQQKFKEEEENIEKNRKKSERKLGESAKKVVAPIQGIFGKIFNFIKTITGGIAVDFAFNWLKDDKNKEKLEGWFGFIKDHWKWIVGALGVAAVAQIIGPLAGVFNIVTAAVPMIIGAVKLFASPLGLKVLAAIALGILAFKGGKWIVNQLAGGENFKESHDLNKAMLEESGLRVNLSGTPMIDTGELPNPFFTNYGRATTTPGSIPTILKPAATSELTTDVQKEAIRKYFENRDFIRDLRTKKDKELGAINKKYKALLKKEHGVYTEQQKKDMKLEKDNVQLKYHKLLIQKFPKLGSDLKIDETKIKLTNLINNNDKDVSKKVTPSSKGEGTITFQNLPGVTTGANVPLGGGGVATQVSNISSKNNGDPYRLLTPSIYGIFV